MSHNTGTVQTVTPPITVGPDTGAAPTAPNTWTHDFAHMPAPGGTKFVILHFINASLPANNRLEVDLGYGTDVFTSDDGASFWTRPVNIHVLPGDNVPIRYITDGAASGSVQLDRYGRGESLPGSPGHDSISNSDPFLPGSGYAEPQYDDFWFCNDPPNWENVACIPAGDIRRTVAQSVGMIVTVHGSAVSTCSVTCIGPDLVITAGHCLEHPETEVPSSSVIFNYQTTCGGNTPGGYSGKFFKVLKMNKYRWAGCGGADYCILQLKVPLEGIGVPAIPMRGDLPAVGEQIFGVHHPNGAVKKISPPTPAYEAVNGAGANAILSDMDVSGGSSGSGLFDTAGRIVGVLSCGPACGLGYYPTASILDDIATTPAPPTARDVMLVFDRSGSMSAGAGTGNTKIEEARDAASLFLQLIRSGTGNRAGLVSFSTVASDPVDFALSAVNDANKTTLIGPAPYSGGIIGDLDPDGFTTIGGGLDAARLQFPVPGANPRTILLLTDGLQNRPPLIETVEPSLSGLDVNVIGFGTESNLNGTLLNRLAQAHNGLYTRAGTGLELKKFFALAFGNIFESGALMDPEFFLPAEQREAEPLPFRVCGEETITVVAGWDREDAHLALRLITPAGAIVDTSAAGVERATGRTWTFLRLPLPYTGERDGEWQVIIFRPGGGEFPPPAVDVRYFVNTIAKGGPVLRRTGPTGPYYSGDTLNPLVKLEYADETVPHNAAVKLTVTRPDGSVGNVLTAAKLGAAATLAGDTIPPRQATLMAIESDSGAPVVNYVQESYDLIAGAAPELGLFEPGGIFGNPLPDLLRVEGNYTFHAVATYGEDCVATRELLWTVHVATGIDPDCTTIVTSVVESLPGGKQKVRLVITPCDRYGNHLGPGLVDGFTVSDAPGSTVSGAVQDNGDGSYEVTVIWDPAAGNPPGIIVEQPGRPPLVITEPAKPGEKKERGCLLVLLLALLVLILWFKKRR